MSLTQAPSWRSSKSLGTPKRICLANFLQAWFWASISPDGAAAVVWVRDVIGSEAVIQTSDQTKWRMVLVDPKEFKYPTPPTEDAACTYWRLKERIA
jgi:hypothetical protein